MEITIAQALYFLPTIFLVLVIYNLLTKSSEAKRRRTNLPPSPPALPFIGHLLLLKQPVHRALQNLSNKYGPIYSLKLGVRNAIVVSSPSLAEECLNRNDIVFANRPNNFLGWKIIGYNYKTMGASPYGPHWRNLRRLSTVELLSAARLNSFLPVRRDEVKRLVNGLVSEVSGRPGFGHVAMRSRLVDLSMNVMMRMVAGKRYFGTEAGEGRCGEGERFKELIREVFELSATSNPVDFLPAMRWVDFSGLEKRMWEAKGKIDGFFQGLIDERRNDDGAKDATERKTMIDTLLSLQESEPETYSDEIIKGHVMTMVLTGTDSSAATIEWAMSLLLNHPKILNKARAEIDNIVGNNRLVDESDYVKLPYLQGIINETLRLYPPAPTLVPHQSSEDCTVGGYSVKKGTMLIVNAWAIHRDPAIWEDPTRFWPERYEGAEVEPYKFIPFGMGRRSCPGTGLANRVVGMTLGALIQCFDWKRTNEALLDMLEGQGLTMPKAEPLEALCKPRDCIDNAFTVM
ncbi:unnamed protein product [Linum tenue]|uniref:Cytochrome P450 n=1 Tax=Linum tenue TaxID=586396 RepID=A0AAV0P2W0_9ROSI|nr:unnamed protein product [Linum tenue]